jgi:redox-sensitive bicupin YhaK (pirin superfamily)
MLQRNFDQIVTTPPAEPGFIGPGHTAVEVLSSNALQRSDPFVLLMDDRLDLPVRRAIGGAHPHAGLETVTLILEGQLTDRDEGELKTGDLVWMTAGRGIIHNEHVETEDRSRVLQLWIRLSKAERNAPPRFEIVRGAQVPVRREAGVTARLYSGNTGDLNSSTLNHVPVTLIDLELEAASSFEQTLPASYNGFVYILKGRVRAKDGPWLNAGQVGWLDRPTSQEPSMLRLESSGEAARVVLYAGEPQREPLIQRGPFVADDEIVLQQMVHDFHQGHFTPMSQLKPSSARPR